MEAIASWVALSSTGLIAEIFGLFGNLATVTEAINSLLGLI